MRRLLSFALLPLLVAPLAAQTEEEMAEWMAAIAPDEHHAFLGTFAGEWTFASRMWMEPGGEPMTMEGSTAASMELGGRYLVARHTGTMMGMPFEGRAWTAYDKAEAAYLSTWIDNVGTGIMLFRGQEEDGALVLHADYVDPMTQVPQVHEIRQWVTDGGYHMAYYITPEGGERALSMEIRYARSN